MPLFVASWWRNRGGRVTAVVGNAAAFGIAFLTASSTPLTGIGFGLLGPPSIRSGRGCGTCGAASF